MTIYWTFVNTPGSEQYFEAQLEPSVGDNIFEFNLAVRNRGENRGLLASENYVPGKDAHGLTIRGTREQDLLLLVRDDTGTEKRIRYSPSLHWAEGGDVAHTQSIAEYRKYFENSQGLTEDQMYCKAVFDEYQYLEAKTAIIVRDYDPNVPIEAKHIDPQDLMRRKILAKELATSCKEYFEDMPAEWHDIQLDAQD